MTTSTPAYFSVFENLAMTRTDSGVLTVRFHTDGGPATFIGRMHTDLPRAVYEIGDDRDNRVLVLTGTGDRFMTDIDGAGLGDIARPANWDRTVGEGRRVMQRLVDLEMPVIAAVNGPVSVHSEYAFLSDIVVAADTTVFSDFPHLTFGIVPGDGVHIAWEEALGLNRSLPHPDPGLFHRRAGRALGRRRRGPAPGQGSCPRAGTGRAARRQAPTADPLPGRHPAPARQPSHGRRHRARNGPGRPHSRRSRPPAEVSTFR